MNYKLRDMSILPRQTMNQFNTILKSCIPADESSKRHTSIFSVISKQSKSQTLLTIIEGTFENIVQTIQEIPTDIEEKLEDLMGTVTEIPTAIEEWFDDIIYKLNEYVQSKNYLT
jgi:hypothetical protein